MEPEEISINELGDLLPEPYEPDWTLLESSENEEDFSRAAFELLKECGATCSAILIPSGSAFFRKI